MNQNIIKELLIIIASILQITKLPDKTDKREGESHWRQLSALCCLPGAQHEKDTKLNNWTHTQLVK